MYPASAASCQLYDELNRLIEKVTPEDTATYVYDAASQLTEAENSVSLTELIWNDRGWLESATETVQDVRNPQPKETQYSYDHNGNITGIEYPDGAVVSHTYNGLNLPATLVDGSMNIVYTYDHEGQLTKESHSDGTTTEYAYDNAGLLTSLKEVNPANSTYRQISYTHDDVGNVKSEERIGTGIPMEDATLRYTYDSADRLTRTVEFYDVSVQNSTYTYDSAGNLKTEVTTGGTTTYAYDLQNRLTTKNGVAYSYDKEGNLLSDGTNTYSYDAESRMILGTNKQGETSAYGYNALGVRVLNVQEQHNINYDFRNYIGLGSRYLTHDYLDIYKIPRNDWQPTWETGAGHIVQTETATYTKEYVVDYLSLANRDLMVYNEGEHIERHAYDRAFRRVSTTFTYMDDTARGQPGENIASDTAVNHTEKLIYRTNHLTSTLFAVDEDGVVALHMMYDEWGNPQVDTEFNINKSGVSNLNNYTGYTYDDVLGIYYAQNRFYDASTKRFIQEDPIKDGMNWYSYVGNNPVNKIDPTGLADIDPSEGPGEATAATLKPSTSQPPVVTTTPATIEVKLEHAIVGSDVTGRKGDSDTYISLVDFANIMSEAGYRMTASDTDTFNRYFARIPMTTDYTFKGTYSNGKNSYTTDITLKTISGVDGYFMKLGYAESFLNKMGYNLAVINPTDIFNSATYTRDMGWQSAEKAADYLLRNGRYIRKNLLFPSITDDDYKFYNASLERAFYLSAWSQVQKDYNYNPIKWSDSLNLAFSIGAAFFGDASAAEAVLGFSIEKFFDPSGDYISSTPGAGDMGGEIGKKIDEYKLEQLRIDTANAIIAYYQVANSDLRYVLRAGTEPSKNLEQQFIEQLYGTIGNEMTQFGIFSNLANDYLAGYEQRIEEIELLQKGLSTANVIPSSNIPNDKISEVYYWLLEISRYNHLHNTERIT